MSCYTAELRERAQRRQEAEQVRDERFRLTREAWNTMTASYEVAQAALMEAEQLVNDMDDDEVREWVSSAVGLQSQLWLDRLVRVTEALSEFLEAEK